MKVDEKNFSAIDDFLSKRGIRKSMNVDDKLVLYVEQKIDGSIDSVGDFQVTFNRNNPGYYEVEIDLLRPHSSFSTYFQSFRCVSGRLIIEGDNYLITLS